MEYPFKDLQPLDEATARDGYYRDWSHIDADTFHQISELVKFIREKGYGSDTREAISQALERVYHDAAMSGNANMEVSMARKHFKDLASRLDASDADMRNISVDWINKNLGKLDQSFMSEEFLQQMAGNTPINAVPADGSLTTPKYADKSITAEKTDFIEVSKTDKSDLVDLFEGGLSQGVIYIDTPSSTDPKGGLVALMRGLKVGDKYTIEIPYNEADTSANRFLLYGLPDNYNYPDAYKLDHEYIRDYSLTEYTFVAEHTNVGLYVSRDKEFKSLYEGNIKLNRIVEKLDEDLLPNPKDIEVVNLDAHISTVDNTSGFKYKGNIEETLSAFFNVEPGKTYKVDVSDSANLNRFRIYGLKQRDWDKLLIEQTYIPFDYTIYRDDDSLRTLEFTVPSDCLSVGIYLSSSATSSTYANVQVEELEITTERIMQEVMDKIMPMINHKFFVVGEPGTYLMSNDIDPTNVNVDDIMAIYESIEADPHVKSKKTLGTNINGDPIYEYTIVKPRPKYVNGLNPTPISLPYEELGKIKILLLSGVHGDEKGSPLGLALFIKELIENKDDETLRYIRNNAIIKVVPIANPWGINNNTRNNQNAIDLNRDFIAQTQNESQLIAGWMEDNANAVVMIDYHNSAGETSYWVNEAYPIYYDLYFSVMSNLNDHWATKYGMSQNAGALAKSTSLTTSTQFARDLGMLSWTMEASRHSETMITGTYRNDFDATAVEMGNELLINSIASVIKYYS